MVVDLVVLKRSAAASGRSLANHAGLAIPSDAGLKERIRRLFGFSGNGMPSLLSGALMLCRSLDWAGAVLVCRVMRQQLWRCCRGMLKAGFIALVFGWARVALQARARGLGRRRRSPRSRTCLGFLCTTTSTKTAMRSKIEEKLRCWNKARLSRLRAAGDQVVERQLERFE